MDLFETINEKCLREYQFFTCDICDELCSVDKKDCGYDCAKCLQKIHFNGTRNYDCTKMSYRYVCSYSNRYASEIVYLLKGLSPLGVKKKLKVLSIGCGPCTELIALDYLKRTGKYCFDECDFYGIDKNAGMWDDLYNDFRNVVEFNKFHIVKKDAIEAFSEVKDSGWKPDLIFMQYFLSNLNKYNGEGRVNQFVESFARYVNEQVLPGCYIVINDINLTKDRGGAQDYLDIIGNAIYHQKVWKGHFRTDNSDSIDCLRYGVTLNTTDVLFDPLYTVRYGTKSAKKCGSAWIVIKR